MLESASSGANLGDSQPTSPSQGDAKFAEFPDFSEAASASEPTQEPHSAGLIAALAAPEVARDFADFGDDDAGTQVPASAPDPVAHTSSAAPSSTQQNAFDVEWGEPSTAASDGQQADGVGAADDGKGFAEFADFKDGDAADVGDDDFGDFGDFSAGDDAAFADFNPPEAAEDPAVATSGSSRVNNDSAAPEDESPSILQYRGQEFLETVVKALEVLGTAEAVQRLSRVRARLYRGC